MKIRLLERELEKSGYQLLPKRGKGNHRLYFNPLNRKTVSVAGKKGNDVKPYQLKFLPNLERATL